NWTLRPCDPNWNVRRQNFHHPAPGQAHPLRALSAGKSTLADEPTYLVYQLAEVEVPRKLFAAIVEQIGLLRLACASGRGLQRWPIRSVFLRRASTVRCASQFAWMSKEEASCALAQAATGGLRLRFLSRILVTVLSVAKPS